MRLVRITFADGNTITTRINGTEQEIRDYYKIGSKFNLGTVGDDLQSVVDVEFVN
jgi:hypothetical protein